MNRRAVAGLTTLLVLVAHTSLARGQTATRQPVVAELVSTGDAIRPGMPLTVGVRLSMSPGWHTYAAVPGAAGRPTRVRWRLPRGFTVGALREPTPRQVSGPPVVTYGHVGEVVLLTEVRAPASSRAGAAMLRAEVEWAACSDVCVQGVSVVERRIRVEQ